MTPETEALARKVAAIPAAEFHRRLRDMDAEQYRNALYLRFRFDYESFCRWCWPDRYLLPFNELTRSILSRSDAPGWRYRVKNTRHAIAAPRGYGKSELGCYAQIIHAIMYDLEACIMMLSCTADLAKGQVKDIRNACSDSESPLWSIYGPIEVEGPLSETLISPAGLPPAAIFFAGFGGTVRGTKHITRGIRPGLTVLDDGENPKNVRSSDQRREKWNFLTKDIDKLGPREGGMRLWIQGTVLHTDSMLANALKHPGYKSERWQAIISWPDNPDLWAQCGRLWCDLTKPDREAQAEAFYEEHREAMDEGVEVLDPKVEPIYVLYTQIWGGGLAAFLQEKQNDPRDPNAQVFDLDRFVRCRIEGNTLVTGDNRKLDLANGLKRRFMRWDPAMGDAAGDYGALAVGLQDTWGYKYIVDGWMRKAKPSEQLAAMWALCERWRIRRVSLESNGFQKLLGGDFAREKARRKAAGEYWQVQCIEERSTTNKEMRIASLEPDCHNGWLQFGERLPPEMLQQFEDFPNGAHDDGPDAVEGCHAGLGGSPVRMATGRGQRLQ